jgi:hypothetical protein
MNQTKQPNKALQLTAARRSVEVDFLTLSVPSRFLLSLRSLQETRRHYPQLAAECGLPGSGS